MKWAIRVLISMILILNLGMVSFASNLGSNNHLPETYSQKDKIIPVYLVNQDRIGGEPLLINGVVLKKDKKKNTCLIEIISETYKGYVLAVKGNVKVEEGKNIEGFFYKNEFAPIYKKGRLR